jgi:hypothetical protein
MGGFASGKYALAICDRCGFSYQYTALKKEWTGFKVCVECYEPKHPQLMPKRSVSDPQALQEPRPDRASVLDVYVNAPGDSSFVAIGMMPVAVTKDLVSQSQMGTVTALTT